MIFNKKKKLKLITHNGTFHADDVFATVALFLLLGEENCEVIRTRDEEVIKKGDYVYDVGRIYNSEKNKFDHHQEGFDKKRENGISYSSFGLIWKKYGEQICGSSEIANKIDRKIVQPIDAIDTGISIHESTYPGIYQYLVVDMIDVFNVSWNEKKDSDILFLEAVKFSKRILEREILKEKERQETKIIIKRIYDNTSDKRIIVLDNNYSWMDILSEYPEPLFVVLPSSNGNWHIWSARDNLHSFDNRRDFPKNWAGKVDKELAKITGVEDAIFCHNKRFICAAKSKEGAIELAKLALSSAE